MMPGTTRTYTSTFSIFPTFLLQNEPSYRSLDQLFFHGPEFGSGFAKTRPHFLPPMVVLDQGGLHAMSMIVA